MNGTRRFDSLCFRERRVRQPRHRPRPVGARRRPALWA